MRFALLALLAAAAAFAGGRYVWDGNIAVPPPPGLVRTANVPTRTFTVAGNFSTDIAGEPDSRPSTWGRAGATTNILTFQGAPPGDCIKLERIAGDFILWPTAMGAAPAIPPPGTYMGGLGGIQAHPRSGNRFADWAADDTFVYVQTGTNGPVARAPFDVDLRDVANSILGPNHQLAFVQAVWLNDTGLAAHMELTFSSLQFRYVQCDPYSADPEQKLMYTVP